MGLTNPPRYASQAQAAQLNSLPDLVPTSNSATPSRSKHPAASLLVGGLWRGVEIRSLAASGSLAWSGDPSRLTDFFIRWWGSPNLLGWVFPIVARNLFSFLGMEKFHSLVRKPLLGWGFPIVARNLFFWERIVRYSKLSGWLGFDCCLVVIKLLRV